MLKRVATGWRAYVVTAGCDVGSGRPEGLGRSADERGRSECHGCRGAVDAAACVYQEMLERSASMSGWVTSELEGRRTFMAKPDLDAFVYGKELQVCRGNRQPLSGGGTV